jgi:Transposase
LEKLHRLTGANIAASARLTGSLALDGDWELVDILSTSSKDDKIALYLKDGSNNFTEQTISNNADGAFIDEIGIVELINQKLGVDNREKIATGQVIKALILNGLGMVSRPLYLFSQFFEDKAIEKLNRTGINSEYLNDETLGRVMDDIYQLGLTNLFIEIGLLVIKKFKIETSYAHLDSTSFHLHGNIIILKLLKTIKKDQY